MKEINHFPAPVGDLGWFKIANNQHLSFANPNNIDADYDFVIVGAGFAGVSAAARLAELRPGASIALLEALQVGMGDSGRNAGFMIDIPHPAVGDSETDLNHHKRRLRLNKIVMERLRKIKKENNLKFDWRESGKHVAAREKSCLSHLENLARLLDGIGESSTFIEKDELAQRLGTNYYIRSLYTPGTILINPAEVIRGLASALPKNVKVFENTPVSQVIEGPKPQVRLVNGKTLRTSKVILTVSAFINHFGIEQSGRMFGITSFGAFTRELNGDELKQFDNVEPWGCTAAHPAGTTVRYTPSKRVYVRNGLRFCGNQRTTVERVQHARTKLRKAFEARFPKLNHVDFEFVYGGMIPLTYNNQSLFANVAENVFAGAVGDGMGITRSNMLGLYLADLACNVDSEELRYLQSTSTPSWCPPEPFRSIGANLQLAFHELQAGGEI